MARHVSRKKRRNVSSQHLLSSRFRVLQQQRPYTAALLGILFILVALLCLRKATPKLHRRIDGFLFKLVFERDTLKADGESDIETVPLVYFNEDIHYDRCPAHLISSLSQARRAVRRGNPILLVGGPLCESIAEKLDVEFIPVDDLLARDDPRSYIRYDPKEEEGHYKRIQNSLCLKRWRVLNALMNHRLTSSHRVLFVDSDTLLYRDPTTLFGSGSNLETCDVAIPLESQLPVAPGFTLISGSAVADFVKFMDGVIQHLKPTPNDMRVWAWYVYLNHERKPQGLRHEDVSLFVSNGTISRPKYPVCSLSDPSNGFVFDKNLKFGEHEYEMTDIKDMQRGMVKTVTIKSDEGLIGPFFTLRSNGQQVAAAGLHFQGTKKEVMGHYKWRPDVDSGACGVGKQGQSCTCNGLECTNCTPFCKWVYSALR